MEKVGKKICLTRFGRDPCDLGLARSSLYTVSEQPLASRPLLSQLPAKLDLVSSLPRTWCPLASYLTWCQSTLLGSRNRQSCSLCRLLVPWNACGDAQPVVPVPS
jgi:hypothetical protein